MTREQPREALLRLRRPGQPDFLYWLQLKQAACGGWLVQFGYAQARRQMTQASKTPAPVPYAVAATIYRIYYEEKVGKGFELIDARSLFIPGVAPTGAPAEPDRRPFRRALAAAAKQIDVDPLTKNNSGSRFEEESKRRPVTAPRKLRF